MATTGRGKSGSKTQGGQQTKASTTARSRSRPAAGETEAETATAATAEADAAATATAEADAEAATETPGGSDPATPSQPDPVPAPAPVPAPEAVDDTDPAPVAAGDGESTPTPDPATTETDPPAGGGGGAGNGGGGSAGNGGGSDEGEGEGAVVVGSGEVGDPEPDDAHWSATIFSGIVVVGSISFVLVMLYIFNNQLHDIENSAQTTNFDRFIELVGKTDDFKASDIIGISQLYMEKDAQFLRTERSQSLVASRLTVMVIAELIGLCLIVLGSSFIFARIRGKNDLSGSNGSWSIKLISEFPGVILCAFGTFIVFWALNTSIDENAKISTNDRPLYLPSKVYIDSIKYMTSGGNGDASAVKESGEDFYKNCVKSLGEEKCAAILKASGG